MKTIRLYNLWICLIALLALSCSQREGLDGSCGYLTIGLESEVEGDILVRSAEEESAPDPMIYRIQVVDADGNVTFSIFVCPNDSLIMEFCKYGGNIEVLSPKEVRESVTLELRKALDRYDDITQ